MVEYNLVALRADGAALIHLRDVVHLLAWSMELPTRRWAECTPLPAWTDLGKNQKETMTAISALARDMASVRHAPPTPPESAR